jgi:ATP-binding cassette subfamily B protein
MAVLTVRVTTKLGKMSKEYFVQRQKNLGIVNGFIEEMVSGQRVVKVYCHEKKAVEEFAVINENLRNSVYNANKIASVIMPINGNIGNLGYVLTAVVGALIALGGLTAWYLCGLNGSVLTLGTLVAFLTLQKNFTRPISSISNEINSIAMASAGTDRVYGLLDEPAEIDNGNVTLVNTFVSSTGNLDVSEKRTGTWAWMKKGSQELTPLQGLVTLTDVDFSYVPEKQVLFDITLTAYPGQKIAFVGGTGAGKTTITNLINRFYEIQEGAITYDGFDVRDIEKDSLRRSLGFVLQETKLFSASVLDNIRYGRLDATDEECRKAAKLVYADSFIRRLPKGYHTVLAADGGNLSQGERQLLAIARAAVANPPVLILDEATSSIDTRTEKLIQKGMDSLMKGRTTFVIAHRLSTVQNANYIMVMDNGRIIERGRHDELLALKGKYYELYTGNQITQ